MFKVQEREKGRDKGSSCDHSSLPGSGHVDPPNISEVKGSCNSLMWISVNIILKHGREIVTYGVTMEQEWL